MTSKPQPRKDETGYHFTLTSYEPIDATVPMPPVNEEMVEQQLVMMAQGMPDYETLDRSVVEAGDAVELSVKVHKASDENEIFVKEQEVLELGQGYMPQNFEQHLIGASTGDNLEFDFSDDTTPEADRPDYHATATIHSIKEGNVPEITDEWAARTIPGVSTVEELKNNIREQLKVSQMMELGQSKVDFAAHLLTERLVEAIPDELFDEAMGFINSQIEQVMMEQNITREEFLAENGFDENSFNMQLLVDARQMIAQGAALDAYADHEEIDVPLEMIGEYLGIDDPDFIDQVTAAGQLEDARLSARRQKAAQELAKKSKIEFE